MDTAAATLESEAPPLIRTSQCKTKLIGRFIPGIIGLTICATTMGVATQERRGVEAIGATNVDLGGLRAFERISYDVRIKNNSWLRAVDDLRVNSSCGCISASLASKKLGRRETTVATIITMPKQFDLEVSATLDVRRGHTPLFGLQVYGVVIPPFAGWPDQIMWERQDANLVCRVDPGYVDWIKSGVVIIDGKTRPLQLIDGAEGVPMLVMSCDEGALLDEPMEVGLRFGDSTDGMNWWGWSMADEEPSQAP